MPLYRLMPQQGAPIFIQAGNLAKANSIGLREFPAGMLRSAGPISVQEMAALDAEGVPLPVAARQRLEVYRAVQRERAKADARVAAMREKERERVRIKREQEAEKRAALRAQQKAEREAERKRKEAAARRAKREAEKLQVNTPQATAPVLEASAPVIAIDHSDARLPWED
jgi:hypothetical protein